MTDEIDLRFLAEQSKRSDTGNEMKVDSAKFRDLTNAVTEQLRRDAATNDGRRGGR